jgi:GNAT superfamily N-acetyltransferase
METEVQMMVANVRPFKWQDWEALWELRSCQLAEEGIHIDPKPGPPDLNSPYEQDYHRMDQVYLAGRGNFWIARIGDLPVGHVGAQEMGDFLELQRMYVRLKFRRQRIGTQLVQTLIAHACQQGVRTVELWTAEDGPGRFLYQRLGFQPVMPPDPGNVIMMNPQGEIRMQWIREDNPVEPYDFS